MGISEYRVRSLLRVNAMTIRKIRSGGKNRIIVDVKVFGERRRKTYNEGQEQVAANKVLEWQQEDAEVIANGESLASLLFKRNGLPRDVSIVREGKHYHFKLFSRVLPIQDFEREFQIVLRELLDELDLDWSANLATLCKAMHDHLRCLYDAGSCSLEAERAHTRDIVVCHIDPEQRVSGRAYSGLPVIDPLLSAEHKRALRSDITVRIKPIKGENLFRDIMYFRRRYGAKV